MAPAPRSPAVWGHGVVPAYLTARSGPCEITVTRPLRRPSLDATRRHLSVHGQTTVEESLALVDLPDAGLTVRFYDILFERYPAVQPMFQRDTRVQAEMLRTAVVSVLDRLEDAEWLTTNLHALGKRHAELGVTRPIYSAVAECMIAAMSEIGGDRWTDAMTEAWQEALGAIAGIMLDGYPEEAAESAPPGDRRSSDCPGLQRGHAAPAEVPTVRDTIPLGRERARDSCGHSPAGDRSFPSLDMGTRTGAGRLPRERCGGDLPVAQPAAGAVPHRLRRLSAGRAGPARRRRPLGPLPQLAEGAYLPFTYPPLAAALFTIFTVVPLGVGQAVFAAISIACLLLVCRIVLGHLSVRPNVDPGGWPSPDHGRALARTVPRHPQLRADQPRRQDAGDRRRPGRSREVVERAQVGMAISIKLTPAVFLLLFFLRRDWRTLVVSAVSAVAYAGIGYLVAPDDSVTYWTSTLFDTDRIGSPHFANNQSLKGELAGPRHRVHGRLVRRVADRRSSHRLGGVAADLGIRGPRIRGPRNRGPRNRGPRNPGPPRPRPLRPAPPRGPTVRPTSRPFSPSPSLPCSAHRSPGTTAGSRSCPCS